MTDHIHLDGHNEEADFERQDLGAKPIILFLVALTAFCLLVALLVKGMYSYLDAYQTRHEPVQSPLVQQTKADTRTVAPGDVTSFPSPGLSPTRPPRSMRFACRKKKRCTVMGG